MNDNKLQDEIDFHTIDGTNTGFPTFVLSMLKLGRILTEKVLVRRELTANKVSQLMGKYRNQLGTSYTAKEIRDQLWKYGELRGGGVQVEWQEISPSYGRTVAQYHFTFSQILKPADYLPKEQHEPD